MMASDSNTKSVKKPIVGDAGINLQLTTNLFLGNREMGEKILGYLIQVGDIFLPEVFDGGEFTHGKKTKFDSHDLTLPLKAWINNRYSLGIIAERNHPIATSLHVMATDFLMFDRLGLSVESKWFSEKAQIDRFITIAKDLYNIIQANSGYIQNWRHERTIGEVTDSEGNIIGYQAPRTKWLLKGLFWANFFGPEYVDMFGRNKLIAAPWHKVENLPDGGLLLFLSESPFDASKPDYEVRKKQLYAELGEEAFSGSLVPKFRTEGRKKRDARPLIQSGGVRDDVFH